MQPFSECVTMDPDCSSRLIAWRTRDLGFFWHRHAEAEILVAIGGEGLRHVGDHRGAFRPGQACLMAGGLPHALSADAGRTQHHIALQFRAETLLEGLRGRPEARDAERILRAAGRGLLLDGPAGRAVCRALRGLQDSSGLARYSGLVAAIAAFAPALRTPLASPRWQGGSAEQHPVIATLTSWLAAHAGEPIGLAGAAAFVGMNPSACARLFRRHTGHSIVGWLNHLRVGRACDLLRDTDRRIIAIGLDAGFANQANFNRIFRQLVGQTPRAYRAGYRDLALDDAAE